MEVRLPMPQFKGPNPALTGVNDLYLVFKENNAMRKITQEAATKDFERIVLGPDKNKVKPLGLGRNIDIRV